MCRAVNKYSLFLRFASFSESVPGSLDLAEDFLSLGFPNVSFRVQIALRGISFYRGNQLAYAGETAVANTIDCQVAEEAFDEVHP